MPSPSQSATCLDCGNTKFGRFRRGLCDRCYTAGRRNSTRSNRSGIDQGCSNCGTTFRTWACRVDIGLGKYCSRKCAGTAPVDKAHNALERRIKGNLRCRLWAALRGARKSANTFELVGTSIDGLKQHLEAQFTPGMSWDNYGKNGWEVDHIRPCASFDLTSPAQQRECFHFTNLQPLWARDNAAKRDRYDMETV